MICRAVASLRPNPNNRSELLDQEVFGRRVEVETTRGAWARCKLSDGYRGWLPVGSLSVGEAYEPTHLVVRRFAAVKVRDSTDLVLPMGSLVRVTATSGKHHTIELPGDHAGLVLRGAVRKLATLPWHLKRFDYVVREVVGTPYLWGGRSTFGFDCSGLVQFLFSFFGRDLPRDSSDQAMVGRAVRKSAALRRYDLLFFADKGKIDHVAVYLGGSRILHASGHVRIESLDPKSKTFRPDLQASLIRMRRIAGA